MYEYKRRFQSKTVLALLPLIVLLLRQLGVEISESDLSNFLETLVNAIDSIIALGLAIAALYGRFKAEKRILPDNVDDQGV